MSEPEDDDSTLPAPHGLAVRMLAPDLALLSFPDPSAVVPAALSACETELALAIYAGESNESIASKQGENVKRVSRKISALYRKLGVGSRAELVLRLRGGTR